ncbi:MAG: hypothetical protein CL678_02410, partial [Bdellovibrionaceae bacterium]|nr:hypothetical protein [Pseudobdellovibrionaceae bacterium]
MKSRRNFRIKRKYTYAHKKRRRAKSRRRTKIRGGAKSRRRTKIRGGAKSRRRTKQSQAGVNDKDENPCEENNASLDELIREKNCDNVEGHIEGQTIGKGKGYCSGKNCISEDSIETIRKGKRYQDPFTRKYLNLEKYDAERKKRLEKIKKRLEKRLEKRNIAIRESLKKKKLAVRKSFEEIKKKIQEPEWSYPIASFEGHISESLKEKNIAIRESFKNITVPAATWDGLLAAQKIAISVSRLLSPYAQELIQYAEELRKSQQSITHSYAKFNGLIASSRSASSFARLLNKYGMELIQYAQELDKSEQSTSDVHLAALRAASVPSS